MLISVLIPCFNEKKTIEEIVTRINKLKNLNIEIIIIDDKSNDGTKEILQKKVNNNVSKIIYNDKIMVKDIVFKKDLILLKEI